MLTVENIVVAIGTQRLQTSLGVGYKSIRSAVSKGQFPASWLTVVRDLASETDLKWAVENEAQLFAMKSNAAPDVANDLPNTCDGSSVNNLTPIYIDGGANG